MVIAHSILFLDCGILTLSCQFVNYLKLSDAVQLCNGFLQLEENFSNYFEATNLEEGQKFRFKDLFLRGLIYFDVHWNYGTNCTSFRLTTESMFSGVCWILDKWSM